MIINDVKPATPQPPTPKIKENESPTNIKIGVHMDGNSFSETLEKLNQLNAALKKAKSLIEELAESKVLLDLNINQANREDVQGNFCIND